LIRIQEVSKQPRLLASEAAVCLWIPSFGLACERIRRSEARARPAAVLGPTDSSRLWQISPEAGVLGVRSGMTIGQGIGLAPTLLVIEADPVHYAKRFDRLVAVLGRVSPVVEAPGEGLVFAGMDGLTPLYGPPANQLAEVRRAVGRAFPELIEVAELRLGWAMGKFTAWVAATAASTDTPIVVAESDVRAFLGARPVSVLPVPRPIIERLQRLGLTTLAHVASLPEAALVSQFGRAGRRAWRCASGQAMRYVRAPVPERRIAVALEFPEPVALHGVLGQAVSRLVGRALARPARRGRSVKAVKLAALLEQGGSWSTIVLLKEPATTPEAIAGPLRHRLEQEPPQAAVWRLRLAFTAFGPAAIEHQLFERDAPSSARSGLEAALTSVAGELRARRTNLFRVMELAPWSRIPERRHALIDFDP